MTSNPPLLPRDGSPRAELRKWLLRSTPGRVLLASIAIKLFAFVVGTLAPSTWTVLDLVDAIGSLGLIFVVCYALTKGAFWAKRRLLWRVRRKLILSYVFVGLVPGLLIIAFFLIAGLVLFLNVSSFLLQSRVRNLVDQARFMAQSAVAEAEHGDPPEVLRNRLAQRLKIAQERFPFAAVAIVPVEGLECPTAGSAAATAARPMSIGQWQHLDPPDQLPRWVRCDGFAGLLLYQERGGAQPEQRLLMRAVAIPAVHAPRWAVIVDIPFTLAVEERLRDETGVRLGQVAQPNDFLRPVPPGRPLEPRSPLDETADTMGLGQQWVSLLDVHEWETGATAAATVAMRLNMAEVYTRISTVSTVTEHRQPAAGRAGVHRCALPHHSVRRAHHRIRARAADHGRRARPVYRHRAPAQP